MPLIDHETKLMQLRAQNMIDCARFLRDHGPATLTEIAAGTGLSRPTARDRIADLQARGLAGPARPLGERVAIGRPSAAYAFRADAGFVAAAELNKHYDRILLGDLAGRELGRVEIDRDAHIGGIERLHLLRDALMAAADGLGAEHGPLLWVGLALPGVIDPAGAFRLPSVLPEVVTDVASLVAGLFPVPVHLSNDVDAAALAEHRLGAARGCEHAVFVLTWHKVSAGLIISNQPHLGHRHLAGELNLLRGVRRAADPEQWDHVPGVQSLLAAAAGDPSAAASLDGFAEATAVQVAALILTIDPDLVVLGGPLLGTPIVDAVIAKTRSSIAEPIDIPIVTSELHQDGPVLGVLLQILDHATASVLGQPLPGATAAPDPTPTLDARRALHR